jgi:cytochrome b561
VHTSFYVLLIAMPIVGYTANSAYGATTPVFGLFELPPIVGKNEALATPLFTLHRWVGYLVILLVLTHVSGALYHTIRGDGVITRMLPGGGMSGAADRPLHHPSPSFARSVQNQRSPTVITSPGRTGL